MKPFFFLVFSFLIAFLVIYFAYSEVNYLLAGKIALSIMLVFTSIGHFKFAKGMELMIPSFIPYKSLLILLSGLFEILAAILLLIPQTQVFIGIVLIIFFLLILPTNIYAAQHKLNYETGNCDGKGLSYLWFRVPFQILLMVWTYLFVVN